MKLSRIAYISLFLFLTVITFGSGSALEASSKSTSDPETLLIKANECRNSLYGSSNRMKYRHNWQNCINRYENVYKNYPKSEQAPWAMYRSAQMYTRLYGYSGLEADLDKALEIYEVVTEEYSTHRLADDAQYKMGEVNYEYKKDLSQAYVEFLKVDIKFPNGDMRPRAREMMDKLSITLGEKGNDEAVEKDS